MINIDILLLHGPVYISCIHSLIPSQLSMLSSKGIIKESDDICLTDVFVNGCIIKELIISKGVLALLKDETSGIIKISKSKECGLVKESVAFDSITINNSYREQLVTIKNIILGCEPVFCEYVELDWYGRVYLHLNYFRNDWDFVERCKEELKYKGYSTYTIWKGDDVLVYIYKE